jgi:hypothetical protein
MRLRMAGVEAERGFIVLPGSLKLAAFMQDIAQIHPAHGIAGMARHGFRVGRARSGSISGGMQQRAQIVQRQPVRGLARSVHRDTRFWLPESGPSRRVNKRAQIADPPRRDWTRCARRGRGGRIPARVAAANPPPWLFARRAARAALASMARPRATVFSTKQIDLPPAGAVIYDGRANRQAPVDDGGGRRHHPGLLEFDDDPGIDALGILRAITEANHVEFHRRQQFQFRRLRRSGFPNNGPGRRCAKSPIPALRCRTL